jgi:hypothetical protein
MLMLVVALVAGWLGWICYRARVQREAWMAIRAAGGAVWFDWQLKDGHPTEGEPGWLPRHLGSGFFEEVAAVWVFEEANDSLLFQIGRLRYLQWLNINSNQVTDAGLAAVAGLTNLQALDLSNTRITDAGLASLARLKRCQAINVQGTKVTPAGIAAMKQKCPWMTIYR